MGFSKKEYKEINFRLGMLFNSELRDDFLGKILNATTKEEIINIMRLN